PLVLPQAPGVSHRFTKISVAPCITTISTDFYLCDFSIPGPGGSVNSNGRICWHSFTGPRARYLGFNLHLAQRNQLRILAVLLPERIIDRLIISVEWPVGNDDPL